LSFSWRKNENVTNNEDVIGLLACVSIFVSAQSIALAQNGQRFGYTATDRDNPALTDHEV
jgi:hypothetical protein